MAYDVSVVACKDYARDTVKTALIEALTPVGGLDWVQPGMKVAIKTNLVMKMKPESAGVVHPMLLTELCRMLRGRGADVVLGDSPGGPWNGAWVKSIYATTGVHAIEETGARLNDNFKQETVSFPEGVAAKSFPYTSWLKEADLIIDVCKLKTHGLTGLSCAVKNLFGVIPGTVKPEFHYLYPRLSDFGNMLVDLNEYVKPRLTIVDAVIGMEGNGPTQGTPRYIGAVIASGSTYAADLVAAKLINLNSTSVPTISAAVSRGLSPDSIDKLTIFGDVDKFTVSDYKLLPIRGDIRFSEKLPIINRFLESAFGTGPKVLPQKCIGCGRCREVCQMKTIQIMSKKAKINPKKCIRCFCCQEFCPEGAIVVHRSGLARLIGRSV